MDRPQIQNNDIDPQLDREKKRQKLPKNSTSKFEEFIETIHGKLLLDYKKSKKLYYNPCCNTFSYGFGKKIIERHPECIRIRDILSIEEAKNKNLVELCVLDLMYASKNSQIPSMNRLHSEPLKVYEKLISYQKICKKINKLANPVNNAFGCSKQNKKISQKYYKKDNIINNLDNENVITDNLKPKSDKNLQCREVLYLTKRSTANKNMY